MFIGLENSLEIRAVGQQAGKEQYQGVYRLESSPQIRAGNLSRRLMEGIFKLYFIKSLFVFAICHLFV